MSNLLKAFLIAFLVIAMLGVGLVFFTFPHWWCRVGTAVSYTPSEPGGIVMVYKSTDGNLLFWIQEDSLKDQYIFYPSTSKIGVPNGNQFIRLASLVYSKDVPVPVVFSENRVKVETDLNIIIDADKLEFTTFGGRRIVANLKSYEQ
ncbi:MAG: hypothetical protein ABIV48_06520 [Pyrinomonadaceae bacterium]